MTQTTSTKKAFKNIAWLLGEKGITMGLSLGVSIVLARYLGSAEFGQLNYLTSFIALLVPFSSLGLNGLVVRELVNGDRSEATIVGTALTLRVVGGVVAILLTTVMCLFIYTNTLVPMQWMILASIGSMFTSLYLFDFYFQSIVESKYAVKSKVLTLLIASGLKVLAVYYDLPLQYFLMLIVLEPALNGLLLAMFFVRRKQFTERMAYHPQYSKDLISQSKWLIFSGFMSVIYLKIDQLMIGDMLGDSFLGDYSIAVRISEVWYFFPVAFVSSFFPKLLKNRTDQTRYQKNLQLICDGLFWLALALAVFMSLSADWLVYTLYGAEYAAAAQVLVIHIWAGVFIFMRALLSKWLIAESQLKFSLVTHGLAALVNIVLNLWWIPVYGIVGAAWATLISYACSSYLVLWLHKDTLIMAKIMSNTLTFPVRVLRQLLCRKNHLSR
ncbi:flippase [Vibrio sp. CDRSL-10 TSBA]